MHRKLSLVVPAEGMLGQRKFGQRVIIALQADGSRVADLADDLDARTRFADAEAFAGENLLVAEGVQLGEALAELELAAVDVERAVGALLAFDRIGRQAVGIDAEEVAHAGLLEAEVARHAVEAHHMDDIFLDRAEDPLEHVVEMHADVGGDAAALVDVALPRSVVPLAAGGDVSQINVVDFVLRAFIYFLLQCHDAIVEPKLQDVIGLVAGLLLDFLERVDVVWIEHHRLFADDVAAEAKAVADEGVVCVVRGADTHPLQGIVRLHLLGAEAVEEFVFREEGTLREETVQPPDAVELVICSQKVVARILYGFEVARRYIARRADECETSHYASFFSSESLESLECLW